MDIGVEIADLVRVFNEIYKYLGLFEIHQSTLHHIDGHVGSVEFRMGYMVVLHIITILSQLIFSGERSQFLLTTETA